MEALYSQLQHLVTASNRFNEVKNTHEAIEKIIRQLESQGEDVGHQRSAVQQILSKFPMDVIVKLEESKEINEDCCFLTKIFKEICVYSFQCSTL